jgi:hypothetical protein
MNVTDGRKLLHTRGWSKSEKYVLTFAMAPPSLLKEPLLYTQKEYGQRN